MKTHLNFISGERTASRTGTCGKADPAGARGKPRPSVDLRPLVLILPILSLFPCRGAMAGDQLTGIDPREITVGGLIGKRIDLTLRNNLLVLDAGGAFLAPFREKSRDGGYIGLGKLIETAARFAGRTGDERALQLRKRLVSEALAAQDPDGYLGILKPEARIWGLWDLSEMAYLIQGLVVDWGRFGEERSLEGAKKLADHIISRWTAEPGREPGGGTLTVHMAVVGLEPALLALQEATGDRRYLRFCLEFRKLAEWNPPIALGRWGRIEGHVYAYLCMCLAQLRLHRIAPDPRLLEPTRRALDFLTKRDGLAITGECGDHECWHDTQEGTINLGETCATAYWIRILDELLRMEGDSRHGDLLERALYNALFAAQSPDGRRIRYYTPFDGPRSYFDGDTYCCPSNFRRIVAELPEMIYYRCRGGIAVSLYTASKATIHLDGGASVRLEQETDYPDSEEVLLRVDPSAPARFPIRLRIPRWCAGARAWVDGTPVEGAPERGRWLVLDRAWKAGDSVRLRFPMPWRFVKGRRAQAGRVALMRGPVVHCLSRARHKDLEGMDLRLIAIDPGSLQEARQDAESPYGKSRATLRGWRPGAWYPLAAPDLALTLTPFPDPGGEATYFKVPNPQDPSFAEDELMGN